MSSGVIPARRLYGPGFEGWDYSQASYVTAYVVMVAGFLCALGVWSQWQGPRGTMFGAFAQFVAFAPLEAVAFLLCGSTHHLIATYQERGQYMGRAWGAWNTQWMFVWSLFMVAGPLASAFSAGCGFAFSGGRVPELWYRLTTLLGAAVALYEVYLCANNWFDATGLVIIVWGALASIVGVVGAAASRLATTGALLAFAALLLRTLAFAVVLLAPASCKTVGAGRHGCPFSETFDQNAWFHMLLAAAVVTMYLAVLAQNARDRETMYQDMLQSRDKGGLGRACCTLPRFGA